MVNFGILSELATSAFHDAILDGHEAVEQALQELRSKVAGNPDATYVILWRFLDLYAVRGDVEGISQIVASLEMSTVHDPQISCYIAYLIFLKLHDYEKALKFIGYGLESNLIETDIATQYHNALSLKRMTLILSVKAGADDKVIENALRELGDLASSSAIYNEDLLEAINLLFQRGLLKKHNRVLLHRIWADLSVNVKYNQGKMMHEMQTIEEINSKL